MKPVDVATGLRLVIEILEKSQWDYMIVGSIAGSIYGEPRLTRDLDLVLSFKNANVQDFSKIFSATDFYVPPAEIISQEIVRAGQINLLHHQSGLKVDLVFQKAGTYAQIELSRRRRIEILSDLQAWVAAPEDVIIGKLKYFREGQSPKHLLDIRGILANSVVDEAYLKEWVAALELESYFRKIHTQ